MFQVSTGISSIAVQLDKRLDLQCVLSANVNYKDWKCAEEPKPYSVPVLPYIIYSNNVLLKYSSSVILFETPYL